MDSTLPHLKAHGNAYWTLSGLALSAVVFGWLVGVGGLESGPMSSSRQRILETLETTPPNLTKRYEPVFIGLVLIKVSLRLATYQHVAPQS